jgi:hypothetical protein
MTGYYAEMKDPKNADKTMQELKDIVLKNLSKDPIYYVKDGQFGVKGLGYETEVPGLGTPKEPKGKYKSSGYGDLKENQQPTNNSESKLRKVIREIVDDELEEVRGGGNYGILTINTAGKGGEGGKRFIPTIINMPLSLRKKFGEHMVYNPGSETFYISQILYNNLIKGYADQPAIKKLIMDIPPMLKQLLNKTENYGQPTELPKQFKMYLPFKEPVEKAKEDKFNKNRTKQYWSAGDFLFPNLNKEKYSQQELEENYEELDYYMSVIQSNNMSKDEAYDFLEDQGLESSKIDSIINQIFQNNLQEHLLRKMIRESVEKELASINKEAEHEALQNKLEKIEALIDKKQSQLTRLDEDEDMKDLTDKKKVKQIEKDIKTLEKAKSKVEKMMSKGKKKEVIGETEDEIADDAPEDFKAAIDNAEQLYDELGNLEDTLAQIPDQYKKEVERHLKGAYGL